MKVFIYDNKEKDNQGQFLIQLKSLLDKSKIKYEQIFDKDLSSTKKADAIFTLGGDGTILGIAEFATKNDIPIIGINIGKIGFLTEFERLEMENAVNLLKNKKLVKDKRLNIEVNFNGNTYYALNDVYLQRIYTENIGAMTAEISVKLNQNLVENIKGDGVIVSTPTGSTAYSLSVGGAILSPDVDVFSVSPIAAHSLSLRPIIFNSKITCELELLGKAEANFCVDGKMVSKIGKGEVITISKATKYTTFLRKDDFNFYKKLSLKLKD